MNGNDTDVQHNSFEQGVPYHVLGALALAFVLLGGLFLGFAAASDGTEAESATGRADSSARFSGIGPSRMVLGHLRLRDTVYTTDSLYLDLNLHRQRVTVHHRDGRATTYPVSSGNPYIREGMATPPGLYTVQSMTPMAISRQFDDARLHHWIGIQGGIGFHGLDGSGYYWNLGLRPSSHGCVRMARDDVAKMYRTVHPGALILVHHGDPARVVAFCDPDDTARATLIDSANVFNRNLGRERLRILMTGMAWIDPQPRIVHLARQRLRFGMAVGDATKIPKQKLPEGFAMLDAAALLPAASADFANPIEAARVRAEAETMARRIVQRHQSDWSREREQEPEYGE